MRQARVVNIDSGSKPSKKEGGPPAKPVSLKPLTFEEAVSGMLKIPPNPKQKGSKATKGKSR
jgi:hypothetical protein